MLSHILVNDEIKIEENLEKLRQKNVIATKNTKHHISVPIFHVYKIQQVSYVNFATKITQKIILVSKR